MSIVLPKLSEDITEVLCGGARGVDELGRVWATNHGIPVKWCPADWDRYGNRAGMVRNREMAEDGDVLVAVWDGESPGTKNMIEEAHSHGLEVHVFKYDLTERRQQELDAQRELVSL